MANLAELSPVRTVALAGRVGLLGWLGWVATQGGWGVIYLPGHHVPVGEGWWFALVGVLAGAIAGSVGVDLVGSGPRWVRGAGDVVSAGVTGCLGWGYLVPAHGDVVVHLGVVEVFVDLPVPTKVDLFVRAYLDEVTRLAPGEVGQFTPRVDYLREWFSRQPLRGVSCREVTALGGHLGGEDVLATRTPLGEVWARGGVMVAVWVAVVVVAELLGWG